MKLRCRAEEEITLYNEYEARREIGQSQAIEEFDHFSMNTCDCCQKRSLATKFKYETICKKCAGRGILISGCIIEIDDEPYRI